MYRTFLSLRYLRTRFVNLISVAGVMVGVAVLIVVTAVMDGFQAKVREVLRGTLSHLILTPDPEAVPPYAEFDQRLRREEPRIVATAPQVSWYVFHPRKRGGTGNAVKGFLNFVPMEAVGVDWALETKVSQVSTYLKAAQDPTRPFWHPTAAARERKTCLMSRALVEYLYGEKFPNEDVLGTDYEILVPYETVDAASGDTKIDVRTYRLVVSGIYDTGNEQADVNRLYFDRADLRQMALIDQEYMEIRAALVDYEAAASVRDSVKARFGGLFVQTWEDVQSQYLKAVNNEKVLLLVVLSFIVLLGGFTILATLTLTVVEKTRDIGLLKAIGGTTTGILTIFLRSGLLIGVLGGILGLALGLFVTDHVNWIKDRLADVGVQIFPPDIYLFREIPTHVDVPSVAAIVLGSVLLAFLAGLPPALRGARMDPVEALRYE